MFTVVESIVVVLPSTFKFPVIVTLPASVGLVGIPIVTVCPEIEVSMNWKTKEIKTSYDKK